MVGADDGALKQRPYAFDATPVHVAPNPLLRTVIHAPMLLVGVCDPDVAEIVVGIDVAGDVR